MKDIVILFEYIGAGEKVRGWLNGIDISWVISHG